MENMIKKCGFFCPPPPLLNDSSKLDPVDSTVRQEVMKLCSGSVKDSNGWYFMLLSQYRAVPVES